MIGLRRAVIITGIGVSILGMVGCSGPETAAAGSSTSPTPSNAVMPANKKGNTMDTTVYPAPAGVKTGIEGGKKD